MKIDVTTVLNKRADKLDFEFDLDLTQVACDVILPEDVDLPEPCHVAGCVKDQNNCMSLSCTVTVKYHTLCDRCLDDIDGVLTFDLEKTVSTDEAPEGYEDDPTYDDVAFVSESAIDIDPRPRRRNGAEAPAISPVLSRLPGALPEVREEALGGRLWMQ